MGKVFDSHLSDDLLERYVMGAASDEETALADEHVIICPDCQDRLQEIDDFVQAFRIAAPRMLRETKREPGKAGWFAGRLGWLFGSGLLKPAPLAGALAAVVLGILVVSSDPRQPGVSRDRVVELRSFRSEAVATATPSDNLTLKMDTGGLVSSPAYEVEIADMGGKVIWRGRSGMEEGVHVVRPGSLTQPGPYWVRVLQDDAGKSLLREYGLEIRPAR
jgi:hypothetical protein